MCSNNPRRSLSFGRFDEDDYYDLLGVLNSSVACFWLKQVSHDKGNGGYGGGIADEEWERFFEFTGTKLQEFPLARERGRDLARAIDIAALRTRRANRQPRHWQLVTPRS